MKLALVSLVAGLVVGAAHAAGTVEVSFRGPESFTDIRDHAYTREQNLAALERVLVEVAGRYVAAGRALSLEITDVDLAGEPSRGSAIDTRVMRGGADWPRIRLSWKLEGGGAVPRSGSAIVQDMTYLDRRHAATATHLVAERRMLEAWFREQFGKDAGD